MASDTRLVTEITPMEEDFAKWYTDIVKKADLADYSSVKGCMVIRPYGYAIWENIQRILDGMFKDTGHENVYMPLFIPESLLDREKDHVEGFAPEVAWVTHGGSEPLTERLCVRPTSETLFCEHYANIVHSYRDLPKLYNQWCSVVRWEKTTRPFLRTREFLWQEGHTVHATKSDAMDETLKMLNVYADFCENHLAMPVIKGQKTEKEKFAGAVSTYAVESLMHDGKALQAGTTHFFGDGFARAFGIQYADKDNTLQYAFQTSWGVSTRLIGAIIMSHSDNSGLVLPPAVAPVQVVIIPIMPHKEGVLQKARDIQKTLLSAGIRVKIDESDQSPGWKFAEHEMRGVPVRLEIGPKDLEKNQCVLVRRDSREKIFTPLSDIARAAEETLRAVHDSLFEKALQSRREKTYTVKNLQELETLLQTKTGFIKAMWCGDEACESTLKERFSISSRCIPFEQEKVSDRCAVCQRPADMLVYWGNAY